MARTFLNDDDVRELLRSDVDRVGSQLAWARAHDFDRTVLNLTLSGRREITPAIIDLLKLEVAYTHQTQAIGRSVLTVEDVLKLLREDVEKAGGQSEWSRRHKHGRTHVNRVLSKIKPMTPGIVKKLGLRPVYVLRRGEP